MWNWSDFPRPGDDPWIAATGMEYAAVGCGVSGIGYVLGYRRAADALFSALRDQDWFSPMVRPYLFVWRHYLELHLKRLYHLSAGCAAPTRHSQLLDLWHAVRPLLPTDVPHEERLDEAFSGFEDIIRRVEHVDPGSVDNRYHESRTQVPSLQNAPKHLDVAAYHRVMSRAANLLEYVDMLLEFRELAPKDVARSQDEPS